MADKKNRVKITWSDIVNECVRTYEKNRKIKQENTLTGSIIGDSFLFDALMGRNNRSRDDERKRRR